VTQAVEDQDDAIIKTLTNTPEGLSNSLVSYMTLAPPIPPPTPSGHQRDPERTRERILEAAVEEFAAVGFTGARVDSIAERAGVNKRMLYHYFGNKLELFRAIIEDRLEENGLCLDKAPESVGEAFVHFHEDVRENIAWLRLLQWEALQLHNEEAPIGVESRRQNVTRGRELVKRSQAQGLFPGLDSNQVLLSLMGMVLVPYLLPQMTKLMVGEDPQSEAFRNARNEFFRQILPSSQSVAEPPVPPDDELPRRP
jgi:TetR/AcrR family transcriptional regulator